MTGPRLGMTVVRWYDRRRSYQRAGVIRGGQGQGNILGGVRGLTNVNLNPRALLTEALRSRVAGDNGPEMAKLIWTSPGERWFAPDSPIGVVHADAAMFIGGIRALLLQSLHPLAMAGVAGHSGYRGDPWGRLQRTSAYLAMTTYGPIDKAEELIARIRSIHLRVRGKAADGRPYAASDPHLLGWVHATEVDSFLDAFSRFGATRLSAQMADEYADQSALIARKLGVIDPPTTWAGIKAQLEQYQPELELTTDAKDTIKFLLLDPPLPLLAKPGYALLTTAAVASLPKWARSYIAVPRVPVAERLVGAGVGQAGTRVIRWAMRPAAQQRSAELAAE